MHQLDTNRSVAESTTDQSAVGMISPDSHSVYEKLGLLQAMHSQMRGEYLARAAECDEIPLRDDENNSRDRMFLRYLALSDDDEEVMGNKDDEQKTGLYDRAMQNLEERQRKLFEMKRSMMEEFTFSPATNYAQSRSIRSGNESVFDRLYNSSKKRTPRKSKTRAERPRRRIPRNIETASCGSSRLEELYQQGRDKIQSQGHLTDREEAEARRRRYEEKELEDCTFNPRTRWRQKSRSKSPKRPDKSLSTMLARDRDGLVRDVETESFSTASCQLPSSISFSTRVPTTPTQRSVSARAVISPLREPSFSRSSSRVRARSERDYESVY